MSLTTLSYSEANRIIDLYSAILMKSESLGTLHRFRYSELKGYTIFDIDNSLKLCNAYRVFDSNTSDENKVKKLREAASIDDSACMSFFTLFAPDNIAQRLAKLDFKTDSSAMLDVEGRDFTETELWKEFGKTETHESFLNYCLTINKSDPDYWEKIYDRLGITWDDRDDSDVIYTIITHKEVFFRKQITPVEMNDGTIPQIAPSVTKQTFFSKHKQLFTNGYILLIFCIGLLFPPVRLGLFVLLSIIGAVQLYFWVKEPITKKMNFAYHIIYEILYIVGIFLKQFGFYILLSILVVWILQISYSAVVSPKTKTHSEPNL